MDIVVTALASTFLIGSSSLFHLCCDHSSAFNFEWIFFILADKKDNYKSLDEFD